MGIQHASVTQFNLIRLYHNSPDMDFSKIIVINGERQLYPISFNLAENYIDIILKDEIDIKNACSIIYFEYFVAAQYYPLYKTEFFNKRYYYDGVLGAIYDKNSTTFNVWSPAATEVTLLIYRNGDISLPEEPRRIPLREESGLWNVTVNGDLKGMYYTYEVLVYMKKAECVDPYARAVSINGLRGAIIDLHETNPLGWSADKTPFTGSYTDAIIYETSIRDITMSPESGVSNKGKYLGLTETNTFSSRGLKTALSHIKELGITHLQLMPIFDFSYKSIDESNPLSKYNWGYDPQNFNVPEGSYSTNPWDPLCRIIELKQMILKLHEEGICVNMDVVFNHVYDFMNSSFQNLFPGYYFRINEDGTFCNGSCCGNDTASENKMMQKFIRDSVLYWAEEYHIDGFRFDLMGLHDIKAITTIREELNKLGRGIMLYGEGWDLNTSLRYEEKASQFNAYLLPEIGFFNDTIRDAIRGNVFNASEKGFVSGMHGLENIIKTCISGCIFYNNYLNGLYTSPIQAINYVSVHDNNTLWDKLQKNSGECTLEERKSMQKLSNAMVLTCQGIPFLNSSVEFCRTKYGEENSYKSPDNINWIDWERKYEFLDVFEYHRGLIEIRKSHPSFRLNSPEKVRAALTFIADTPPYTVAFILDGTIAGDSWNKIIVIYNGNINSISLPLPEGIWQLAVTKFYAGIKAVRTITNGSIDVEGISMSLLFKA